eukprot:1351016-Prymnesium_polylepis.1
MVLPLVSGILLRVNQPKKAVRPESTPRGMVSCVASTEAGRGEAGAHEKPRAKRARGGVCACRAACVRACCAVNVRTRSCARVRSLARARARGRAVVGRASPTKMR